MTKLVLYQVIVKHVDCRVRHTMHFSDKACAVRCLAVMRSYYHKFMTFRPSTDGLTLLWFVHDGRGWSNNGDFVEHMDDLLTLARVSDSFVKHKRDADIVGDMFGERNDLGILRRLVFTNAKSPVTRFNQQVHVHFRLP